jgi:hypothetical protein
VSATPAPPAPSAPPANAEPSAAEDEAEADVARAPGPSDHDRWCRAVDALRAAMPRHGKSLSYARFLGFAADGVRIAFPPDAGFHRSQVVGMSRSVVEAELSKALGRPGKLLEEANAQAFEAAPKSIAEVEATDRASREKQIEARVRHHPAVHAVLRHLGGSVEHIQFLDPVPRESPPAGGDEGEGPTD